MVLTAVKVRVAELTPETVAELARTALFLSQKYASGLLPVAVTPKVAVPPLATVWLCGGVVMAGGNITARAAGELVMLPTELLTMTE